MSHEKDLIDYRRKKARETLRDAQTLHDAGSYLSAVNRIYYFLFYEVTALLLVEKISSAKHSGIRSLFNEHFVKTGIVDTESGKFYTAMSDFRQKGDYGDYVSFEKESVSEWLSKAVSFINKLDAVIDELIK